VLDLARKVEYWFNDCSSFRKEQTRVALVGEKLAIFYRLDLQRGGEPHSIEQQVYCTLRDGLIDQVSLLCSGFQPAQAPVEAPTVQSKKSVQGSTVPASIQVDAFLKFDTGDGQGSTCAILTPSIKRKLAEISSGQVLEVQVDDPTVREDIEAWSRLSGNSLLKMDQGAGQDLHFYLVKK
jgi:TusA-related sulfurtransferase